MKILTTLTKYEAVDLLICKGISKPAERDWTINQVDYLTTNGRSFYTLGRLNKEEFQGLTFQGSPDQNKTTDLSREIKINNYRITSLLFLRDLNKGESGSFYVENGIHRVSALRYLLRTEDVNYRPVQMVLISYSAP